MDALIILGGNSNPVFTAPVDLGFAEQLAKVTLRIHSGLYEDETSAYCHWHIPETHYLESWSDIRAYDVRTGKLVWDTPIADRTKGYANTAGPMVVRERGETLPADRRSPA